MEWYDDQARQRAEGKPVSYLPGLWLVHRNYKFVIQAPWTETGGLRVIDLYITDPQQDHSDHDDQHE